LIRPPIAGLKEKAEARRTPPPAQHQSPPVKKTHPSEQTNAENFYYAKQISNKTQMVLVLRDGEKVTGVIDWYDKGCLRIKRDDGPVMVYKHNIKYMYKDE
jgi:sRNA-binding regulator protein Hfq